MHERRFFFLNEERNMVASDIYSPGEVLGTIFEYAQDMGLFREMPQGTQPVRARWEDSKGKWGTARDLGPPPLEKATQSNRMSPAGIPMFYACDDEDTALRETATDPGYFAIGMFDTLRPITLLDLTEIPPIPSIFEPIPDSADLSPRSILTFLHHVAEQVSRPIERGDHVHVDYVPTQVVTEYVRDQLMWQKSRVDGIEYHSSVHVGHVSYVLFATQDNIGSTLGGHSLEERWLRLTGVKHRWRDVHLSRTP